MARRASYADSIKSQYSQVVLVDNGGFFPEDDIHRDYSWFMMDAMKVLGTDAVGVGERDLRFGVAYLRSQVKRTGLPVVCANLIDKSTRRPVVAPYVLKRVGNVRVGIFGLLSDKALLGVARDSLVLEEPTQVARQTVAELRKKGAEVVVLLGQLGKVECEDLVGTVEGIDAVVVGHDVPVIQKGRMINKTVACYGGEQGQYLCQTVLALDANRHSTTGEADAVLLGPEVGERPEIAKLVKSFEDGFNEKMRKADQERVQQAAQTQQAAATANADHFLGAELCIRCHKDEGEQWKTTAHSQAWQTLVDQKKDAMPDCVPCHVLGYRSAGGFQTATATPHLVNVQCENCHGMGTQHDAFAANPHKIGEQTCRQCHLPDRDPDFDFDKRLALIVHSNYSGESIQNVKRKIETGNSPMLKGSH